MFSSTPREQSICFCSSPAGILVDCERKALSDLQTHSTPYVHSEPEALPEQIKSPLIASVRRAAAEALRPPAVEIYMWGLV